MDVSGLVTLGIALVVVLGIVLLIRRAAYRSRQNAPVQERVLAPEPARERRRDRKPQPPPKKTEPARAEKVKPKKPPEPEPEEEEEDEEAIPAAADREAAAAYKAGLAKTRGGFVARLGKIFGKKKIDAALLEELEEVLFTADIGPHAAGKIFESVKSGLSKDELEEPDKIWRKIRETSSSILQVDAPPVKWSQKPLVILTIGVNGVGKTTTIGKVASKLRKEGKSVILAAGDTFRAAATEQLEEWGKRAGVPVVKGKSGQDPSSVIFEAVKRAVDDKLDVVICDTAGRLHSNAALMDELKKIRRVCDKALPGAPHETWMVLDATNGQNAIAQAKTFKAEMEITGIVLTKLDGSAKGGVILGICDELAVPVRFIGVGEKLEDLRPFDPEAFVTALYDDAGPAAAA